MSTLAENLKKRRREEQDAHHYSASSRWYEALSKAISAIERAESTTDPIDRFTSTYWAADGLSQLYGERGEQDIVSYQRWIEEIKGHPEVRRCFSPGYQIPLKQFRDQVGHARQTLLAKEGIQQLDAWKDSSSPEKACSYFFAICRAIRNRLFHADLNLNSPTLKKVLASGADCLLPVTGAAVLVSIEKPPLGKTGRSPAYRFFLYPYLKNSDGFFSDYYLERLFPDEELAGFPEDHTKDLLKQIAKHLATRASTLQTASMEYTVHNWLEPVLFEAFNIKPVAGVRIVTEEGVFSPSFALPIGDVAPKAVQLEVHGQEAGKTYSCLIWTLPWRARLDSVATDEPFADLPITELVHRALIASGVPWAIITNGKALRLLSRESSHRPLCFLEGDLDTIVDQREKPDAQRSFRFLLALFSGKSFVELDERGQSRLSRVAQGSNRHGKQIGDELKENIFSALQKVGEGFLAYMHANPKMTDEWRDRKASGLSREKFLTSDALLDDIYHESLSLMYRLLFLFYAESRELLPLDNELYQTYSLESIRDDVHSVHDDPDPRLFFAKGNTGLWGRLEELFGFLDKGWATVIPPYNGGLFDPEKHQFLEQFAVGDYFLAQAIDLLSRTKPSAGQSRGEGRKKVTYRDLDVRHLGSIYEGILEYTAHIAEQDYVIVRQGSGASATEEYKPVAGLDRDERAHFTAWRDAVKEDPDSPKVPRSCKISGHVEKGRYYLVFGGRESKRKSSGSYYTPDYIVQYLVENSLGPLLRGDCRRQGLVTAELKHIGWKDAPLKTGPLRSEEILALKVLDPAMGSGHFLVAVTEYLARAYRDARLREGHIAADASAGQEFIRFKRLVGERCVYGLDANPMAVELAKLSMWLFTMDPGRPLSFLDHNLRCGDALVNARLSDLSGLPHFERNGKVVSFR